MPQADLSSMGNLMKPMVMAAMKLAEKGKTPDKKKAKIEAKMKMKVKVKHD
jgi:hypothetical protein